MMARVGVTMSAEKVARKGISRRKAWSTQFSERKPWPGKAEKEERMPRRGRNQRRTTQERATRRVRTWGKEGWILDLFYSR